MSFDFSLASAPAVLAALMPSAVTDAVDDCLFDGLDLDGTLARLTNHGHSPADARREYERLTRGHSTVESYINGLSIRALPEPWLPDILCPPVYPARTTAHRLGNTSLTLAVEQCINDRLTLAETLERLWREDCDDVRACYGRVRRGKDARAGDIGERSYGLHAERLREMRRPMLARRNRRGLTLARVAKHTGIDRDTLVALMGHHGYVELVYVGGDQRRTMVTDDAFHAGLGHNVDPSASRIGHAEGMAKAAPFPVFYEECLADMLWTFDLAGIRAIAEEHRVSGGKRSALEWLTAHHGYLPTKELARLSGYSERSVEREKAKEVTEAAPAAMGDGYLLSWVESCMPRHPAPKNDDTRW